LTGIVDVGGGMRGIYPAGIFDYLIEKGITFDYAIGVSAGSANLVSYIAKQHRRNFHFYYEYAFRKEYMSMKNYIRKGSYIDLDYIYSDLSDETGENPVDYDTFSKAESRFSVVATNALTGEACYFDGKEMKKNNYDILKASCCVPLACKPYVIDGIPYYDGGVAEPIPYRKAFEDGCDKVVVVLTRPRDYLKGNQENMLMIKHKLRKYPETVKKIYNRNMKYNKDVEELKELEKTGKVFIVAPENCFGINTLKKEKKAMKLFYEEGYKDGIKIEKFLKSIN